MDKKYKILFFSDHQLSTSGVGTQARYLIEGLIKTGKYSFKCIGAAIKHQNYDIVEVNPDFVIKPMDGFGTPDMLRQAIATEKPDAIFLFTDPRFFTWLLKMEEEIHQQCPIVWWNIWDNFPVCDFNKWVYKSVDKLNCISDLTYDIVSKLAPEKAGFIPHGLPTNIFHPISETDAAKYKRQLLGNDRSDHFVGLWINRNAKRKRPNDVLWGWQNFVNKLEQKHGHKKATLIMHTDPKDQEGPNLFWTAEHLKITDTIFFSTQRIEFEKMNVMHNISDFTLNISYAEGFGLSTLEAMQCGNPIVAIKTGGLTRQVVNKHDGTTNGIALDVEFQSLVGSQQVPGIYEDYCSHNSIGDGILKLYEMGKEDRKALGAKAREYALTEFNHNEVVRKWDESLEDVITNWKEKYNRYEVLDF